MGLKNKTTKTVITSVIIGIIVTIFSVALNKTLNTEDPNQFIARGMEQFKIGNYDEAIANFDKALKIDPTNNNAKSYLVNAYNDKGAIMYNIDKWNDAIEYYNKALQIDPDNEVALSKKVNALVRIGVDLSDQGKYDEAMINIDKALKIDQNDVNALVTKSLIFGKQGKYDEAILYSERALEINPTHPLALNNKAASLYNQGNYDEAMKYYQEALLNYQTDLMGGIDKAVILTNIGRIFLVEQRYDEALEYFEKALEYDPNYEDALKLRKETSELVQSLQYIPVQVDRNPPTYSADDSMYISGCGAKVGQDRVLKILSLDNAEVYTSTNLNSEWGCYGFELTIPIDLYPGTYTIKILNPITVLSETTFNVK